MNVTPAYWPGDVHWYPAPTFYQPTYHGPVFAPIRTAWECPRCKTMNAPHADRCECKPSE